jgi:hypothetical protein
MMKFAKTHALGLVLGAVLYELYYRKSKPGGGGQ